MLSLSDRLAKFNGVASQDVDAFSSCLLAVVDEIQKSPQMASLSLNEWRRWLDKEGYEVAAFEALLQQLSRSILDKPAYEHLLRHLKKVKDKPDGLPEINQYLTEYHPNLARNLTELQLCAMEEKQELEAMAGGWSKKATNITSRTIEGVALACDIFLLGYTIYTMRQIYREGKEIDKQIKQIKEAEETAKRVEREAKEAKEAAERDEREIKKAKEMENIIRTEIEEAEAAKKEIDDSLIRAANPVKKEKLSSQQKSNLKSGRSAIREEVFPDSRTYAIHDEELNLIFRNLKLPHGAKICPIAVDDKLGDHSHQWIIRKAQRDIVKVSLDGSEQKTMLFYLSSGRAGKPQDLWPKNHWYAIEGISDKDDWFNKFNKVTNFHYNSDVIKEIAETLKVVSDEQNLFTRTLVDALPQMYLDENLGKDLFFKRLNENLVPTSFDDGDFVKPLRSVFHKLFNENFEKKFPLLSKKLETQDILNYKSQFDKVAESGYYEHFNEWFSDFSKLTRVDYLPGSRYKEKILSDPELKKKYKYIDLTDEGLRKLDRDYRQLTLFSTELEELEKTLASIPKSLDPKIDPLKQIDAALNLQQKVQNDIQAARSEVTTEHEVIKQQISEELKKSIHEEKILLKTQIDEEVIQIEEEIIQDSKNMVEKLESNVAQIITKEEEGVENLLFENI